MKARSSFCKKIYSIILAIQFLYLFFFCCFDLRGSIQSHLTWFLFIFDTWLQLLIIPTELLHWKAIFLFFLFNIVLLHGLSCELLQSLLILLVRHTLQNRKKLEKHKYFHFNLTETHSQLCAQQMSKFCILDSLSQLFFLPQALNISTLFRKLSPSCHQILSQYTCHLTKCQH